MNFQILVIIILIAFLLRSLSKNKRCKANYEKFRSQFTESYTPKKKENFPSKSLSVIQKNTYLEVIKEILSQITNDSPVANEKTGLIDNEELNYDEETIIKNEILTRIRNGISGTGTTKVGIRNGAIYPEDITIIDFVGSKGPKVVTVSFGLYNKTRSVTLNINGVVSFEEDPLVIRSLEVSSSDQNILYPGYPSEKQYVEAPKVVKNEFTSVTFPESLSELIENLDKDQGKKEYNDMSVVSDMQGVRTDFENMQKPSDPYN